MNKRSIFNRIVWPYALLLIVILSVTFIFVYMAQLQKVKSDFYESAEQIAVQNARILDSYLESMNSIAEQVKYQDEITKYFYEVKETPHNGNIFEQDIEVGIDISSRLKGLLMGRSPDYSIFIFNGDGDYVSSHNYAIDSESAHATITKELFTNELMRIKASNGTLVLPPHKDRWSKSSSEYITLAKELKNDYSDENAGIIEIRSAFPDEFETELGHNRLYIRNKNDNSIVYPMGADIPSTNSYITAPLSYEQWDVVLEFEDNINTALDKKTIIVFFAQYITLIFALFLLTMLIGRYISKPILQLNENVRSISNPGESLARVQGGIVEIEDLEDSFAQMLERLSQASEREKKAYMLALQAQMNPHFLYNTLTVIGAQGLDDGCDKVYEMCTELSNMLRYVAAYENVTVRLSEECLHTKNYLSLMKARYEEYFDYTLSVDDELLDMPVPKLFLQPLVENCFMHGFKSVEPPWKVDISMVGTRTSWELRIKDNGCGISVENADEILRRADECCANMGVGNIGRLGIVNTIVRLRMTRSQNIKCEINGENGAEIIIRMEE